MYRLIILAFIVGVYGQDNNFSCQERINILKDDSSWYGYGVVKYKKIQKNKSLEEAKEIALGDLASKINTKVKSFVSINSSEKIKNSKTNFIQSSSSETFTSTSAEISDYKIDFSGSCSNKQYLVVVKLNKQDFFYQQETLMRQYLAQSNKAISSNNLFKNKLSYIDQTYSSLRDIGRLVGIDSGLLDQYYNQISLLAEEYDRMLSDIDIQFNTSDSFIYHMDNTPTLLIQLKDESTQKNISDLPIQLSYLSFKSDKFKVNTEGIIEVRLPKNLKNETPFQVKVEVLLDKNLNNHTLFNLSEFENPNKEVTIKTNRLRINKETSIDNPFLKNKLMSSVKRVDNKIQEYLKVDFSDNNPSFTIKVITNDVVVRKNNKEIFIVQFTPTIILVENETNKVLYRSNLSTVKGISFQSYDKAYSKAATGLKENFEEIADGIVKAIL